MLLVGKDVQRLGFENKPAATNGISQMWEDKPQKEEDTDKEDFAEFTL